MNPKKSINAVLFKLLAKRDYTKKELFNKLKILEYSAVEIEEALNQASEQGFINDHRFIENYIRRRIIRGYGPLRIQIELEEKGIDTNDILECISDQMFWETLAEKVRKKRFGETIPEDFTEKAKQMRFLQYRGFTKEQIREAFA